MLDFAEFIYSCHQLELESFGLPFTWFNKRSDSSSIFEKLDRILINEQWIYSCRDSRVENLPILGPIMDSLSCILIKEILSLNLNLLGVKNFGSIFLVTVMLLEKLGALILEVVMPFN